MNKTQSVANDRCAQVLQRTGRDIEEGVVSNDPFYIMAGLNQLCQYGYGGTYAVASAIRILVGFFIKRVLTQYPGEYFYNTLAD